MNDILPLIRIKYLVLCLLNYGKCETTWFISNDRIMECDRYNHCIHCQRARKIIPVVYIDM